MLTAPQIVITFTTAVKYDIKNWNKKVADKFDVIKKGDTHMHVTQIKLAEELGIPVSPFYNTRSSGKNVPTFPICHLFGVVEPNLMELNLSDLALTSFNSI
jgi:hypothetical protein